MNSEHEWYVSIGILYSIIFGVALAKKEWGWAVVSGLLVVALMFLVVTGL